MSRPGEFQMSVVSGRVWRWTRTWWHACSLPSRRSWMSGSVACGWGVEAREAVEDLPHLRRK